ncbi:MAG: hypothetical protein ABDI19_06590 [Armatimonadota bacterium]
MLPQLLRQGGSGALAVEANTYCPVEWRSRRRGRRRYAGCVRSVSVSLTNRVA